MSATRQRSYTVARSEYRPGACNYALIAGNPVRVIEFERSASITIKDAYFEPGARFALSLWRRNEFGTTAWRTIILQAVSAHENAQRVPQVRPGARVIFDLSGPLRGRIAHHWIVSIAGDLAQLTEASIARMESTFRTQSYTRLRATLAHYKA
ncbi:hypothetical protein B1A_05553 [mine drainage metagenome]|uniref:Uncharacterized protein n=1 Tax=mine drainage metagenome TaxID=410659 RepID=T1BTR7_9ZZZZ